MARPAPGVDQLERDRFGRGGVDGAALELIEGVSGLVRAVRCADHRQLWPEFGVRRADLSVLRVLARAGELRSGDVAAKLGVDASVVSRQLAALEADGLVIRRPDPADARVSLLALSDRGRVKLEEIFGSFAARLRAALAGWSDAELEVANAVISRMTETIATGRP
ncbi:MarR family winged helix-turn-helix transcriptional regulator [Kribbella deserti]|uniref:MarR family winged helix-turn-helix transcriptional regulator n=1 Tax=Kribbella deserti TaxID=1926257 RepID=A0ABV6QME0_9ACTN